MADWGMVQVLVAFIILLIPSRNHFKAIFGSGVRWVQLKRKPASGFCDRLWWDEVDDVPSGLLHQCNVPQCVHSQHVPGVACWEPLFDSLFNVRRREHRVEKPTDLPVDRSFLCTDPKTILAFILCTIEDMPIIRAIHERPQAFKSGGLSITPTRDPGSGEVLVHITGQFRCPARNLTKREVECLLMGYPPYYREYIECNRFLVPSPIQSADDLRRGGWVIGVGLGSVEPVPVYMDNLHYGDPDAKRGTVFWRSFKRVKDVLENNIKLAFPHDKNVQATIAGITYMIECETVSGIGRVLEGSDMRSRARLLSQPECILAMSIFNESPNIEIGELPALEQKISPILFPVLKAALSGVMSCTRYMNNPGRELDAMIPKMLQEVERVYVQGCAI
jgi:hypothetical protein